MGDQDTSVKGVKFMICLWVTSSGALHGCIDQPQCAAHHDEPKSPEWRLCLSKTNMHCVHLFRLNAGIPLLQNEQKSETFQCRAFAKMPEGGGFVQKAFRRVNFTLNCFAL